MIRSLVAPEGSPAEWKLRRNLSRENLAAAVEAQTLVWIDITDPEPDQIDWLATTFALHPVIVSDLARYDKRPALLVYQDYLFLSLFQPTWQRDKIVGEEVHCILGKHYFITVRQSASAVVGDAYDRAAQNRESWTSGAAYFLYLTAQHIIDSYYPLLDGINMRLNDIEAVILADDRGNVSQQRIYRLRQQVVHLRQMVAPQREVLSSVIGEERLSKSSSHRDLFRHLYDRLLRVYDVIDSQRDLSSNVLDLQRNQEAARLSEAVSRLTIFSMIFLPLTFLVGLFELNFITTEPELTIPLPGLLVFVGIATLMILIASTMGVYFRRQGWI